MFTNKSVAVRFDENKIDAAVLYRDGRKATLGKIKTINTGAGSKMGLLKFNNNEIKRELQDFFSQNRDLPKKVNVILSLEGIITRIVECPVMKKRDLEDFLYNNINEYFALNTDEYCYDYKVLARREDRIQKYILLVASFPKTRIEDINDLMRSCGLQIKKMLIYPECIANLFDGEKDSSVAVFDTDPGRNSVTMLDKGKVFLYSQMEEDFYDESAESKEELLDNMEYFLDFYSARHFGSKIDRICLIGGLEEDADLIRRVRERFGIQCESGITPETLTISSEKGINMNLYCDIYGSAIKRKNIFNKEIDFSNSSETVERESRKSRINIRTAAMFFALITFMLPGIAAAVLQYMLHIYDTDGLMEKVSSLSHVERELDELERLKSEYSAAETNLRVIGENGIDYIAYLNAVSESLPGNVSVKRITIDREQVNISLTLKNGTLDKVRLVETINDLDIFETLELDTVALDNTETSAEFTLIIKKPIS